MREVWKPIANFPGYDASSLGRVRSWRYNKGVLLVPRLLRPVPRDSGHLKVSISPDRTVRAKCVYVHTLVMLAFRGPCPPGYQCRHLNGDPADNRLGNLRWGTAKENARDRDLHGRTARGERSGFHTHPHLFRGEMHWARRFPERRARTARVTEAEVRAIRASQAALSDIALRYGISQSYVSNIRSGRRRTCPA